MREILFRGRIKDTREWVFGYVELDGVNEAFYIYGFEVEPETIGQFTGLTDKNGKKIFENDILQFDYIGKNLGVNGIAFVNFQNGKFGVEWGHHKEFVCLDGFANTTLEVIGNIVDNPELLGNK